MRRAPSPTAGVMSNAMAPPFPVFGNRTAISPAAGGQCRRSLTHIRVPGQGGNGPEGCRSACCSSTPRRKTRTTPFSALIKVTSSYAQAEPKRCKRSTIARLTRRDRLLAGGDGFERLVPLTINAVGGTICRGSAQPCHGYPQVGAGAVRSFRPRSAGAGRNGSIDRVAEPVVVGDRAHAFDPLGSAG